MIKYGALWPSTMLQFILLLEVLLYAYVLLSSSPWLVMTLSPPRFYDYQQRWRTSIYRCVLQIFVCCESCDLIWSQTFVCCGYYDLIWSQTFVCCKYCLCWQQILSFFASNSAAQNLKAKALERSRNLFTFWWNFSALHNTSWIIITPFNPEDSPWMKILLSGWMDISSIRSFHHPH